jgi:LuxR family maltose regulon positive regulatory protein
LTGQVEAARPKLENLDWLYKYANDENELQQREMLGNIAGLKVILAGWIRDYEKLLEYAQQVRLNLPENNWIRGYCAIMEGSSYWANGDLEQAREAFAESASVGIVSGNYHMAVSATCQGAHSFELAGRLKEARAMLLGAYELAQQDGRISPVIGYIDVGYGRILYELNEIDLAEQKLEQSIKFSQYMLDERVEKIGYFLLAKVHMANGDYQAAQRSISMGENAVNNREIDHDLKGAEFPQIRLWIKEGNFPALKAWLEVNDPWPGNNVPLKTRLTYTMHARALVALSREFPEEPYLTTATDLLGELYDMAEGNGWGNKIIEILCLQALAYGVQDEDDNRAIEILAQALRRAAPEGYTRIFVDEGPPMASLLYEALKRDIAPEYVQQLLAAFPVSEPEEDISKKSQVDQSGLIEPLSEREIDVLQLLAKGLTNQVVATRLFISLHTVKAHTRNIYSKLGVNNRTQAVDRARTLGILPPV